MSAPRRYPRPGLETDIATFQNNMLATFHVIQAARRAGVRRIVTASSETVLGLPFAIDPPYAPVDEQYDTRPESVYSLTKHLEEELARKVGAGGIRNSLDHRAALLERDGSRRRLRGRSPTSRTTPAKRKWNLGATIDARDGAQAIDLALERPRTPASTASSSLRPTPSWSASSASLHGQYFPDVEVTRELGEHETLLGIDHARDVLGYDPQYSWRG